jgi:hypothetical protein
MNFAIEVGSGAIIYVKSFIKIGSGIQKFGWWGVFTHTNTQTAR